MADDKKSFNDLPDLDMNIIKGVSWAESMWETLQNGLRRSYLNWCQSVLSLCNNEKDIQDWISTYKEQFEDTCCSLVYDMEQLQRKVISQIEELLAQLQNLCDTLQVAMPKGGQEKSTLYQDHFYVKTLVMKYEAEVKSRSKEVNELQQKQINLCNTLGRKLIVLKSSPLPSADDIEKFKLHLEKLEAEVFERTEKFINLKEKIAELFKELKLEATTQFQKDVLSCNSNDFQVTDENMALLTELHVDLLRKKESVKEEIALLRNKVDDFWNVLDVDMVERASFRNRCTGNTVDTLDVLRLEVKRCEELKRANIKIFVDKLRRELEQVWHDCHCSQAQMNDFGFYYSDCFTEDLLELHEMELDKWNKYYEQNRELLQLLEKHKSYWHKLLQLDLNATGPNRYKNRGGQLLREEKERNKLAKQIPLIEETLNKLADKYEEHHGVLFTSNGETVHSYISRLHSERENNKQQKLSARKIQKEQTVSTPGMSAKTLFPSTSVTNIKATPQTSKRKPPATPLTDAGKKTKLTPRFTPQNSKRSPPKIKSTTTASRSKRMSLQRKKRIDKIRRLSSQKSRLHADETISNSYEEFHLRPLAYSSVCGTIEEEPIITQK